MKILQNILWALTIIALFEVVVYLIACVLFKKLLSPKIKEILLLVAFIAAVVLAKNVENPFLPRREKVINAFIKLEQTFLKNAEFKKRLEGADSEDQIKKNLMTITIQGSRRLDDATLIQRMRNIYKLLNKADEKTCAAVYRGTLGLDEIVNLLSSADDHTFKQFMNMTKRAVEAELNNSPIIASAEKESDEAFDKAIDFFFETLPPEDKEKMEGIFGKEEDSTNTDKDLCWANKTFYKNALAMPEPYLSIWARADIGYE